jgi:hypothetical protein
LVKFADDDNDFKPTIIATACDGRLSLNVVVDGNRSSMLLHLRDPASLVRIDFQRHALHVYSEETRAIRIYNLTEYGDGGGVKLPTTTITMGEAVNISDFQAIDNKLLILADDGSYSLLDLDTEQLYILNKASPISLSASLLFLTTVLLLFNY